MTVVTLHHLFFQSLCEFVGYCFWTLVCFFVAPSEKYLSPKRSPPISHYDLKKDDAQLFLSNECLGEVHPKLKLSMCCALHQNRQHFFLEMFEDNVKHQTMHAGIRINDINWFVLFILIPAGIIWCFALSYSLQRRMVKNLPLLRGAH